VLTKAKAKVSKLHPPRRHEHRQNSAIKKRSSTAYLQQQIVYPYLTLLRLSPKQKVRAFHPFTRCNRGDEGGGAVQ
jgi:hypothetical protein